MFLLFTNWPSCYLNSTCRGGVPLFWSSPLVLQQGKHLFTCHSHFHRGKESLTVQAILTGFGGSSLLQDGCISQSRTHLRPQHSSGSKQWPHFMGWELNPRGNKDWSNLGKYIGPHISAMLPQLPLSWPQLNIDRSFIPCWVPAHTVQQPKIGMGPEQQCSLLVTEEEMMGRGRKKKDFFFSVTISDCFFSEVLTKKLLLWYTFPFVFLIVIIYLKHIVVDGQWVFSADS